MATVYVYSHTHWDREWYQPFEVFRLHLLSVVKRILNDLEAGNLSRFYLDGQAIVLEDVIELEPKLAGRIRALMKKGNLSAGPWYVLPDQMLVSGESLVRNLKVGIELVKLYGEPAMTGYSPDTFGHSHDLPRILNGFGIHSAFVWRGMPNLERGPAFWWQSPDGSRVLGWHFSRGYYQTLFHEASGAIDSQAEQITRELDRLLLAEMSLPDGTASLYSDLVDGGLFPCGADHTAPPANLKQLLKRINKSGDIRVEPIQLTDFAHKLQERIASQPTLVQSINRELRDNRASKRYCNAFLLPGVLSTRLYLKRQNRQDEYRLARFVEPLFAMLASLSACNYPFSALNHAWKLLLRNHPHDSICGCSVDSVHDEMGNRSARLQQILQTLKDSATAILSGLDEHSALSPQDPDRRPRSITIANSSGRSYTGPVPFTYYAPAGEKVVFPYTSVQLRNKESSEELFSGWGRIPYYKFADKYHGWYWCDDVPAFGMKAEPWLQDGQQQPPQDKSTDQRAKVTTRSNSIDNGLMKLTVSSSGQIDVLYRGKDGNVNYGLDHILQDVGDGGDTYNFDPLDKDEPIKAQLKSVEIGEKGPLVGSLILTYELKIPQCIVEQKSKGETSYKRSNQKIAHKIATEVSLTAGGRIVTFATTWNNSAEDHRLEVLLSSGKNIATTFSENHFGLAKRIHAPVKLQLPAARGEEATPDRFPTQRFVIANGQLFLNGGLPEYGVEKQHLSITLLRSVGILSRGPLRTRGGGAGPHVPTPGAQCSGPNQASYAWAPLIAKKKVEKEFFDKIEDELAFAAYDLAEEYETELVVGFSACDAAALMQATSVAGESPPQWWTRDAMQCWRSTNPAVRIVGAFCIQASEAPAPDQVVIRLLNVTENPQQSLIRVAERFTGANYCNLNDEPEQKLHIFRDDNGQYIEVTLGKNQLRSIRMEYAGRAEA